ncbi:hypothetical protein G5V58_12855 [Nocardioides anomalus]|uniref:Laminin G domain-containing protein n=1 Tax=Nocardioides anomalus TaxID=2712223 RepID=A0A6G6WE66_9ACTN|nr:hypothetical protein [Nocardioides anomalus]QIG43532.1 hypothetical protein G5V58_12855 [Nocardioides anomalus]
MKRLVGVAVASLLLVVWGATAPTQGAWSTARVANQPNSSATAALAATHSAGTCSASLTTTSTVACSGTPAPAGAATAGGVTGTDALTNTGTVPASQLTRSVSAASCATVRMDNRASAGNVMLPRYGTSFRQADPFGTTNAVGLDGTGYAAAVSQQSRAVTIGVRYGLGVWFRASAGQSGPLLSQSANPAGATGTADRTLYLNANGTVGFAFNSLGTGRVTSAASYANGSWHFAYATMTGTLLGLLGNTTLYVDGAAVDQSLGLIPYTTTTGYWRLGSGSTALTGGSNATFTGSLSNAVVFNDNAPQSQTGADRLSQAAFTTWAGTATDHWLLGDTGTTTFTGAQPVIGTTSPCTMLNVAWTFTSPTATVTGPAALSAFADGTARTVSAAPGPGVTQVGSLTITRGSSYNAYVSGLRLHVPLTDTLRVGTTSWVLTFQWQSSDAVVLA